MRYFALISTLPFFGLAYQAAANSLPINPEARLQVGANVGYTISAYDVENTTSILPQAFYDNNRLYLEGSEGGFYPYKSQKHHVRLGISYDGREFDPSDANTSALQQLDERQWSALFHASYMYITPVGGFKIKVAQDALNRHDGTAITVSHLSKFNQGNVTIYPVIGATWYDDKYNSYYYGVSQSESDKSGLTTQTINADISPFVSVAVNYKLNERMALFVNQKAEWLSGSQKDSQLVDGKVQATTRLGVNYTF